MSVKDEPRALVVGLGSSGMAAAALLARQGYRVRVNDRSSAEELAARVRQLPEGTETLLGGHPLAALEGVSLVVVSPGVPADLPLLEEAARRGLEVIAEVELAYRSLPGVPLAGITGSNGKTTVTALLGAICQAAGWRTGVGGNIGEPATALALAGPWDVLVWELSSFQLEGCRSLRPRVAVLLNLSPDHLDRHPSMAAYRAAKERLFAYQEAEDVAVLNADDAALAGIATRARPCFFSLRRPDADAHLEGEVLQVDGQPLLHRRELRLLGDHNVANALAASLAAVRLGVPRERVASALATFEALPHRHQVVAEHRGVRFVDDSKGTNIGATAAGLSGYRPGSVHLILGGLGKGQDFTQLRTAVAGRVARIYLIGEAAEALAAALTGTAPLEMCGTLAQAVERAAAAATAGEVVLLSPACASFDQFRDYRHRGEEFARLARAVGGGG
ncbi:MAG: UDP-N-acetylmuramoyl-L-alanine--D-glutamate ligase [Thermoanaerobaculaceae bacterium]|nr:UDP-N-acetylmuramoyl-L-alanine--D-glutamate ligase [Thermoanaerobaculaceae bacterium]